MKLLIIGSGYVGLSSGLCFAEMGHDVTCVEVNQSKVASLSEGVMPLFEPKLESMLARSLEAGAIRFEQDLQSAVLQYDPAVIFLAVGTPTEAETGLADLSYVLSAAQEVAKALAQSSRDFTVVVNKSTVPVGTGQSVHKVLSDHCDDARFAIASNPEFLREGSAYEDFMNPDRIIIGSSSERANALLEELYRPLVRKGQRLVISDTVEAAELTKYAANAFLATKVTFINELALLSETLGVSVDQVSRGIGLDRRIGPEFLQPGPGYGGSCFPKDTLALVSTAQMIGSPVKLIERVIEANDAHKLAMVDKIEAAVGGQLAGRRIAVLGLTFKANTDDMRCAPALTIIPELVARGAVVTTFDPEAKDQDLSELVSSIRCDTMNDAVSEADCAVVLTEWEVFKKAPWPELLSQMRVPTVIDLRNILDAEALRSDGARLFVLGQPAPVEAATEPAIPEPASPLVDAPDVVDAVEDQTQLDREGRAGLQWASGITLRADNRRTRALVTGAAGFLGSHLCDKLMTSGRSVLGVDNLMTGRISNLAELQGNAHFEFAFHDVLNPLGGMFDEIWHLACPASPPTYQNDPIGTARIAFEGTRNLCELAAASGAKLLIASTSEVYGDPLEHPQREEYLGNVNPIGPRACYDEGKRIAETLLFDYARTRGLDIRVPRIFNTYGPRMDPDDGRVISNFIMQSIRGEDITIYGDGLQTRSFCYVDDLISGLVKLMESDITLPVNLGNPTEFTIKELAELVIEQTGGTSRLINCRLPKDDPTRRRPNITKAHLELGWHPKVPLHTGLRKTIEYFQRVAEAQFTPITEEAS